MIASIPKVKSSKLSKNTKQQHKFKIDLKLALMLCMCVWICMGQVGVVWFIRLCRLNNAYFAYWTRHREREVGVWRLKYWKWMKSDNYFLHWRLRTELWEKQNKKWNINKILSLTILFFKLYFHQMFVMLQFLHYNFTHCLQVIFSILISSALLYLKKKKNLFFLVCVCVDE